MELVGAEDAENRDVGALIRYRSQDGRRHFFQRFLRPLAPMQETKALGFG